MAAKEGESGGKTDRIFYVFGEHDVLNNGQTFHERFGQSTQGDGRYSFDQKGLVDIPGLHRPTRHLTS